MKMGFSLFIFLLCSTGNTYGMLENLFAFKTNMHNPTVSRATTSTERRLPPINPTAVLIKACRSTTNPKPTPELIKFLIEERGANINEPVGDTTALLAAIENPITEQDPYLLHLLAKHATSQHKNLALREATKQEKWNTVTLLQEQYSAVLSDEDVEAIQSSSADEDEMSTSSDSSISWLKRTATAAKAGLVNIIRKLKAAPANQDNSDDLIGYTAVATQNITAQQSTVQSTVPLNDASMNIMTLGGMPNS